MQLIYGFEFYFEVLIYSSTHSHMQIYATNIHILKQALLKEWIPFINTLKINQTCIQNLTDNLV